MSDWFSCKGACEGSDPTSDTVKVDLSKLAAGKENAKPMQIKDPREEQDKKRAQEEALKQQQKAEERRQIEEGAKRRRQEEEAQRRRDEQEALERAHAERAAAQASAAAAAAERAAAEEAQHRMEADRIAEENARRKREAAAAEKQEQERLAQEKVTAFCKSNGFGDMNTKKKSLLSGSKFPLHEAVAKHNEELVALMVQLGADKGVLNSKGQTPWALATKLNKNGSMDGVISKLS